MHGPALGVIVQSVVDGEPLLPGSYSPSKAELFPTPDARAGSVGVDPGWLVPTIARRDELDPPGEQLMLAMPGDEPDIDWGPFADVVERWAVVLGRPAPYPLEEGPDGPRLSVRFEEWLMGLPAGWVADVPGVSYRQALTMLGNGVVPQQVAAALEVMTGDDAA
jgi:hypothetical protein